MLRHKTNANRHTSPYAQRQLRLVDIIYIIAQKAIDQFDDNVNANVNHKCI